MIPPIAEEEPAERRGVDEHFAGCFPHIDSDFRGSALNALIASYVQPTGTVLDMGCGVGALSASLISQGNEVTSQDVSDAMVQMCKKHLSNNGMSTHRVRAGTIHDAEENAYDFVIALDVIEHVADDRRAVRALLNALKPGGLLILSVPALSRLYGPKDVRLGHYRRYEREQLANLLVMAGFQGVSSRYWNFLGLLPVWLSLRLKRSSFPEGYRYSRGPLAAILNGALRRWFTTLENRLNPPRGLTLIATARRPTEPQ